MLTTALWYQSHFLLSLSLGRAGRKWARTSSKPSSFMIFQVRGHIPIPAPISEIWWALSYKLTSNLLALSKSCKAAERVSPPIPPPLHACQWTALSKLLVTHIMATLIFGSCVASIWAMVFIDIIGSYSEEIRRKNCLLAGCLLARLIVLGCIAGSPDFLYLLFHVAWVSLRLDFVLRMSEKHLTWEHSVIAPQSYCEGARWGNSSLFLDVYFCPDA